MKHVSLLPWDLTLIVCDYSRELRSIENLLPELRVSASFYFASNPEMADAWNNPQGWEPEKHHTGRESPCPWCQCPREFFGTEEDVADDAFRFAPGWWLDEFRLGYSYTFAKWLLSCRRDDGPHDDKIVFEGLLH